MALWIERLREKGANDEAIFHAFCEPTAEQRALFPFEHCFETAQTFAFTSWFARLNDVVTYRSGSLERLFNAQIRFPSGFRRLAALAGENWAREKTLVALEAPTLRACLSLVPPHGAESFYADVKQAYRKGVLEMTSPTMAELLNLVQDASSIGPFDDTEQRRFDVVWAETVARQEHSLSQWNTARTLGIVSDAEHAAGSLAPFRHALAHGFREGENGFGDNEGFLSAARAVGERDPDLCLRGVVALSKCYNENGLRMYMEKWNKVVPTTGFSGEVIAEITAHFTQPNHFGAAKTLASFLAARGVQVTFTLPPLIEQVDQTFYVGTDVAHMLVGSRSVMDALANLEDPEDWPAAVKRHKCVGFQTGGDGTYGIRVVGSTASDLPSELKGLTKAAMFPLVVADNTLTVSGLVGAGGTPTFAFPSGKYEACLYTASEDDAINYVVVIRPVRKLPRWTWGDDLPWV